MGIFCRLRKHEKGAGKATPQLATFKALSISKNIHPLKRVSLRNLCFLM